MVKLSDAISPQFQVEPLQPQLGVLENDEFEEFPASGECAMYRCLVLYSGSHVHMYFNVE